MKIKQEKEFKPITIILETPEEAEIIKSLTGNVLGSGKGRELTKKIFHALNDLHVGDVSYFDGGLRSKK